MGLPEDFEKAILGRQGLQGQGTAGLGSLLGNLGAHSAFTSTTDSSASVQFAALDAASPAPIPIVQEPSIAYQPLETHNRLENEYEWLRRRIREVMWEPR